MTKQELRNLYLDKRRRITESECLKLSQQICDQFFSSIDLSKIKVVHVFLPIQKNREPDTWLIIDRLKLNFPWVKLALPRVVKENLVSYYLDSACKLQENRWGIQEPVAGNLAHAAAIDLVLVPLLAFDKNGHRVGYGRGYYDRFLVECGIRCKRIGLSLFQPIEFIEDTDENDITLTHCLTPAGMLEF